MLTILSGGKQIVATRKSLDLIALLISPILAHPTLTIVSDAGKSVTVTVADLCPGCAANGLDLSSTAFSQLAALGEGNIDVDWHFV